MNWHVFNFSFQSSHSNQPLPAFLAFLLTACIIPLVIFRGPRTKLTSIFALNTFFISGWAFGIYQLTIAANAGQGLFWVRLLNAMAVFIPPTFFHFASLFTKTDRDPWSRRIIWTGYGIAGMLCLLSPTNLFIRGTIPLPNFYFYPSPGPFFFPYMVFHLMYVLGAFVRLIKAAQQATPADRNPLLYVIYAYLFGFGGGSQTFLVGLGLPMWKYALDMVPIAFGVILYAIFSRQLLDIRIVIRRTLVYSVVTAILALVYMGVILILAWFSERVLQLSSVTSYALAACAITLLFHPLRLKIQRFVDRHFFREAMDQAILREATSGFVHEIKRPLANISLPTQLSLMDLEDLSEGRKSVKDIVPKMRQRLQYILDQTMDAANKIEAIRSVSASSNTDPLEEIDVAQVIRKAVTAEESALNKHGVTIHCDIPANLPPIRGRAKQLEIVFTNLIKNAVEAMAENKSQKARSIEIGASQEDRLVHIYVKDTGPGIQPENRPHLFEPYFTTKGNHGMGMGLFLCKQIVQAHGGTIQVESTEDGARFILKFPC